MTPAVVVVIITVLASPGSPGRDKGRTKESERRTRARLLAAMHGLDVRCVISASGWLGLIVQGVRAMGTWSSLIMASWEEVEEAVRRMDRRMGKDSWGVWVTGEELTASLLPVGSEMAEIMESLWREWAYGWKVKKRSARCCRRVDALRHEPIQHFIRKKKDSGALCDMGIFFCGLDISRTVAREKLVHGVLAV